MTLGVPAALWLLAVLPVIVLLYMLRARRQDVPISSVLLWQRARQELFVHRPARRLERNLLLLLQVLAASLVILTLARPQVMLPAAVGQATVIVLDTSASMQATDVAPSRFEAARAAALAEIAGAGGAVMVMDAGPQPRAVTGFVDRQTARVALKSLHPSDALVRLEPAVTMALAQRSISTGVRVLVFTDRATVPAPGVEYVIVGQTGRNLGITSVRAERGADGTVAIVQVHNAGPASERIPLSVAVDNRVVFERPVEVSGGATVAVPVHVPDRGILTAHLRTADPLAVDDTGYAVLGAPALRVLVIGEPDRALHEALRAVGASILVARAPEASMIADADVVVLNRTPPTDLPPGNYLLVGTTATNLPLTAEGAVHGPQVLRWSHRHPVMRYVDLQSLTISSTLALQPRGGEVLAEGEVPLIWAYDARGIRAVVLGFALPESDLALQIAFPIFLSNTLSWLSGAGIAYQAGDPLIIPAGTHSQAVLTAPDGSSKVLAARDGQFVVPILERVGIYTVEFDGHVRRFAVNTAPEVSEIAPIQPSGEAAPSPVPGRTQRAAQLSPFLLLGVLILLFVEWVLWLRRMPRIDLTKWSGASRSGLRPVRSAGAPAVPR